MTELDTQFLMILFVFLSLLSLLYVNVSHEHKKNILSTLLVKQDNKLHEYTTGSTFASNSSKSLCNLVPESQTLPITSVVPPLVDGSWRWGVDAASFISLGGGGSPPCKDYGYHQGCCVNYQNCVDFSGAFVLNDGSAFLGLRELAPLLPPSSRMLVLGDSLSAYLRLSLTCLAFKEVEGSIENRNIARQLEFADFVLPTGAVLSGTRQSQTCEILMSEERVTIETFEDFFNNFNVIVLNFGAWYHEQSDLERCLASVLPILARINKLPGKAAIFLSGWPSHFPVLDGYWSEMYASTHHYNCASARVGDSGGCLSVSTVEILSSQGFGASARVRGPTNFAGGCVPNANDVQAGWDGVIASAANVAGVPLVDVARLVGPLYSQHLQKFEVFDCSHLCFAVDVFAPIWDAITRSLLITAAQNVSADITSNSSRVGDNKMIDATPSHAIPLHLDFSSLCTARSPLFAPRGRLFERPHLQRQLHVEVTGGLKKLHHRLLCNSSSIINEIGESKLSITFKVSQCPNQGRNISVLFFADIYYSDLMYDMTQWNASYLPRYGTETVYLGQTLVQGCCNEHEIWDFPITVHGEWLVSSARFGDSLNLRVVACEASKQAGVRDGGLRMCALGGALGCDTFSVFDFYSNPNVDCK